MSDAHFNRLQNLLVVVDHVLNIPFLMEKAARLANPETRVHVIQVVHEGIADIGASVVDDSDRLKTFILQAAESELEDALENTRHRFRDRIRHLESATLWNARRWEAILHAATDVEADLILRATDTEEPESLARRVASVIRTPDEWNLLRHATVPVMLVKAQAWPDEPTILAALDVFDDSHRSLSVRVLEQAAALAEVLGGVMDVVYAYPLFEPWVGEMGAIKDYAEIKAAIEADARERAQVLLDEAGVACRHLHLEEGHTAEVLKNLVEVCEASLLVLGTHAREGVQGVLLGNTSERILHAVDCDVVTVHAP